MTHYITELPGSEEGRCLLLGGGTSVSDFDFRSVDEDMKVIAINFCFAPLRIDYQIYGDQFFLEWMDKYGISKDIILIGNENNQHARTDYYYDWETIKQGFHTGYYGLQIAQLLGFYEIYLVGFDYYAVDNRIHYYEGRSNVTILPSEKNMYMHVLETGRLIKDFDQIDWNAKIYNCNPKSKLKKFEFKNLGGN